MKSCPHCNLLYPDDSTFCFLDGQTLTANEDALVGCTLDGLVRLESALARTGWGRMYQGKFRLQARPVLVKLLELGAAVDAFPATLATARRSSHHNVLPILSARLAGGAAVIVRPVVEAHSLAVLIERARLDASQAAGLTLQILAGLGRIHDFGGVHGNLRPTNALYWANGHLDLIDVGFGRSLVREPWEDAPDALSAQHYLAPELNNHQRTTREADVYAAGVIAFELFTGRRPLQATDVKGLRAQLGDDATYDSLAPMLAGLPEPLARWTLQLLHRSPTQRPVDGQHAREGLLRACREANVAPMVDPGRPELVAQYPIDPGIARWERYRELFSRMLDAGYPGAVPEPVRAGFAAIAERVERLGAVAKRATFDHGTLDDAFARAVTGRERYASQIDTSTAGGDAIRQALDGHRAEVEAKAEHVKPFAARALEAHREVLQWEGRSGFVEPYQELVTAYRELADLIGTWWDARQEQLAAERAVDVEREKLLAIEGEVEEIRKALEVYESNVGAELAASEASLCDLGREADRLDIELLDDASRFTAPLRSKPELGPLFRELTTR
ncbi:MAG: protein kinase [Deltaproteobacteria bacterium]|nr:protein kinase [Deltaproteobacteria bacterium]